MLVIIYLVTSAIRDVHLFFDKVFAKSRKVEWSCRYAPEGVEPLKSLFADRCDECAKSKQYFNTDTLS